MFDDTTPQPAPQQPMSGPTPPPPMPGVGAQSSPQAGNVPVATMELPPLEPPMEPMGKKTGGKGKRVLLIVIIAVVLVGLGIAAAAYFFPVGPSNTNNDNTNTALNNLNTGVVVNGANANRTNTNANKNGNTNAASNANASLNANAVTNAPGETGSGSAGNTNAASNVNSAANANSTPATYAVDSDADGLNDYLEGWLKTSTRNADSDGDGFQDGHEVISSYSPLGTGTLAATQLQAFCSTSELVQQLNLTSSDLTTFCGIPADILVSIQVMATNAALYENLETNLTTACAAMTTVTSTVCESTVKDVMLSYEIAGSS